MELSGKIIHVLPVESGTSRAGKPWKKVVFVIEEAGNSQYPRKVAITLFGEERLNNFGAQLRNGNDVRVSVDIESREFNGRWYTDVSAWKIENAAPAATAAGNMGINPSNDFAAAPAPAADPFGPAAEMPKDDLPF